MHYVSSPRSDFAGHEPNPSTDFKNDYRWINEFWETKGHLGESGKTEATITANFAEWYHPNQIGHQKMGEALDRRINSATFTRDRSIANIPVDVAIILDTSGGMFDDLQATLKKVKEAMASFTRNNSNVRFALVTYSGFPIDGLVIWYGGEMPTIRSRFTSDVSAIERALGAITPPPVGTMGRECTPP